MLTLLQGNAVSYDEGGDHSRRDFRRREEDDSRERRGRGGGEDWRGESRDGNHKQRKSIL
jgi:hypothetical protein